MKDNNKKVAVLFDIENISPEKIFSELFKKLDSLNYIAYPKKIIFNNVTQLKKTYLGKAIKDYHMDIVCTYSSTGKNIADFRLYMEAMDLLYTNKELDGFLIVSADSDYSELVIRLNQENKYTIGVGPKDKCKDDYVKLFDEFYYVEDLLKVEEVKQPIITPVVEEKVEVKQQVEVKKPTTKKTKKATKKVSNKKAETAKEKAKKLIKDDIYYQELNLALEAVKHEFIDKGQSEIFYATLVKELKSKSFYLENFKKITFEDLEKCNYKVQYKESKKKETSYISLIDKKEN